MEGIRDLEGAVWQVSRVTFYPQFDCDSGPLFYMRMVGQNILVINTNKVAADLLDRRGTIYSGRARLISKFCYQCL